jgi:hypothetical protein
MQQQSARDRVDYPSDGKAAQARDGAAKLGELPELPCASGVYRPHVTSVSCRPTVGASGLALCSGKKIRVKSNKKPRQGVDGFLISL